MSKLLKLQQVVRSYPGEGQDVVAVDGISLEVSEGEFLALMGPSGCGKSTLLHLMGGMDRPTRGEVWLLGQPLHEMPEEDLIAVRRRQVGFVFQFFYLLPTMTVLENVELPALLAGTPDGRSLALKLLAQVGLQERSGARPATLSGGEMQRVALARAMIQRPRVLIADEPTGNLDSETGQQVLTLLRELASESGTAIVMATHSQEAAAIADRRVMMRDGRLVA